ncbi:MAG: dienelactone hydrolase family protein [Maioricimonas sp. JB049]
MRLLLCAVCATFLSATFPASQARAEIQTKRVTYQDGDTTLEGFLAWDTEKTQAPGVLVVHQWMGLTKYEQRRCKQLAELGYVAFALDIYGQGVRPENRQQAAELAGKYKSDRDLYRRRLNLGLEQLRGQPNVYPEQTAAIGYCFGGTGVLELARSGAEVRGVVSFHGGLDSPSPEDGKNISAEVLVLHGADDPFVPEQDIQAFIKELNDADVDWQMNIYSGAVHSFTQPMAGNDNSTGAAYNERADKRSWEAMKSFFDEIFRDEVTR